MQPNKWQKREKGNCELFQFLYRICKGKKRTQHHASEPTNPKKQKNKIFLNLCNYITFHGIRDIKRLMSFIYFFSFTNLSSNVSATMSPATTNYATSTAPLPMSLPTITNTTIIAGHPK